MKISLNNISPYRPDAVGYTKPDSRIPGDTKAAGNYDAITIQSSSRQIQEKTFSEALSKRIVSEVKQSADPGKVEAIRQQVAAGTYHIDPYAIASKMMLTGEAAAHA